MKLSSRKKLLKEADDELKSIRADIFLKKNLSESFFREMWDYIKSIQGKSFFPIDSDTKKTITKKKDTVFSKPPYANRWGEKIWDPDISEFDYEEMRRKDPTLPKYDPRFFGAFSLGTFDLEPAIKWLYFSDDFGSFAERVKHPTDPEAMLKKYPGYYPNLMNKLPNDLMTVLNNKSKYEKTIGDLIRLLGFFS